MKRKLDTDDERTGLSGLIPYTTIIIN